MEQGDADHHGAARKEGPPWASPGRLLALFCGMSLLVYIDRGCISSNGVNGAAATESAPGHGIQGDFRLSLTQDGVLPAAFMVGLLAATPVFAEASRRFNALRLVGVGLGVWTLAVVGCALSVGFVSLLLCRMAVGVGEASFVALAVPFIDDSAPPGRKALWLALFFLCTPTGFALGYLLGGTVAGALSWRAAFLLEAVAMLPYVGVCLLAPPVELRGMRAAAAGAGGASRHRSLRGLAAGLGADLARLAVPVYLCTVVAMTCYTATLGALAFWGPKAGRDTFGVTGRTADMAFGGITVATGIGGTLAGGLLLDRLGSTLRNALGMCAAGLLAGGLLVIAAFLSRGFAGFCVILAAGELFMFSTAAPSNAIVMWSVPPGLRPFATSMSVVAMHLFGDVPSPPALGWVQELVRDWRLSVSLLSVLLLVGAAAYATGLLLSRTAVDYRTVDPGGGGLDPGGSNGGDGAGERDWEEGPPGEGEQADSRALLQSLPLSHEAT